MDKYEYKLKLDQMKSLTAEEKYKEAADIADTINWRKIKNVNALVKAGEIYENVGRFEESKEILMSAYEKSPIGRMILYRLAEVAIKTKNFDEANDYYQEFVKIAPHDNLKYVLKYEMNRAQGADISTLIGILEELKEQDYSEEWAYELANLYYQAGLREKCIDACDELILWFGDGPYVERALELKMLYQPLTKPQEEKYQSFRRSPQGVVEMRPQKNTGFVPQTSGNSTVLKEKPHQGQLVLAKSAEQKSVQKVVPIQPQQKVPLQQPVLQERFQTQNIQEELRRNIREIINAQGTEQVDDTMDNIKKLVEDIPYLNMPKEEQSVQPKEPEFVPQQLKEPVKEIVSQQPAAEEVKVSAETVVAQTDAQTELSMQGGGVEETQTADELNLQNVLAQWERTKREAEEALRQAERRKLEKSKAKALEEAEELLNRLAAVIPMLDAGNLDEGAFEKPYLNKDKTSIENKKAAGLVANVNHILQQEIDRLSDENAQMDKQLEMVGASLENYMEQPQDIQPQTEKKQPASDDFYLDWENEDFDELDAVDDAGQSLEEQFLPKIEMPEDLALSDDEIDEPVLEQLPEIKQPETFEMPAMITSLSDELKEIFTYFVPIRGMEEQLCQALTGAVARLMQETTASTGNMIIQGSSGSGKTVLATCMIKAIQRETGKLNGKIGKIEASALNQKDVAALLKKVAGGCLIIEKAGDLSRETAIKLSLLLAQNTSGLLIILEDTKRGIQKALSRDEAFAARFSEKINIPIFTNDELVAFAKVYANELGYTIDEMGVLALYNCISSVEHTDRETTLAEVKEIVDKAVGRAEKGGLKKAFSILTSSRYDNEDYIILREKDFE